MRSWRGKAANFAAYFEDPFGSVGLVPAALSVSRDRCRGGKATRPVMSVQASVEMSSAETSPKTSACSGRSAW